MNLNITVERTEEMSGPVLMVYSHIDTGQKSISCREYTDLMVAFTKVHDLMVCESVNIESVSFVSAGINLVQVNPGSYVITDGFASFQFCANQGATYEDFKQMMLILCSLELI